MKNKVVGMRVELRDIKPKIWRRVIVPVTTRLDTVHEIIQVAFGWWNYHMWRFAIKGDDYVYLEPEHSLWGRRVYEASDFNLESFIGRGIKRFRYTYDFGDAWEHEIILGVVREVENPEAYPVLVGGARCGPPEDIGGLYSYYRLCEALLGNEELEEYLQWCADYDPEEFDAEIMSAKLKRITIRV